MKTTISLLLFFSMFSGINLYAQTESSQTNQVRTDEGQELGGIRIGFHAAFMVSEGEKPDTASSLDRFYVGIFHERNFAPMFYWGSGLEYFQNGLNYTDNSKRILHTLSIPLNLKFKVGPVYALGGVAANFKIAEKYVVADNNFGTPGGGVNKSNWFDVPVFFGAGVRVLFLSVEARYHWGLIEARDGLYNRYFQIGGAISF